MNLSHLNKLASFGLVFAAVACGSAPTPRASQVLDQVDPASNDGAIQVRVNAPRERALPNDPTVQARVVVWCLRGLTCPAASSAMIVTPTLDAVPNAAIVKYSPLALASEYRVDLTYDRQVSPSGHRLFEVSGKTDRQLVDIAVDIGRIDVNHMTITRPNGTRYTAKGTATISQLRSDQTEIALATISTGFGIDVPDHAKYKIVVNALGEDGPKTTTSILSLGK